LIEISLFLVLVGSNLEGGFTLNTIVVSLLKSLVVIIFFGVLALIYSNFEKIDLEDGIKELDGRITSDTL